MRVPIPIALVLMVIGGVCWLYGALNARLRTKPTGEITAVVGPVHRTYMAETAALHAAVGREIGRVSGARVIQATQNSFDIDMRPSLARVDDGMGLFVRVELMATGPGRTRCTVFAQPKSKWALDSSSASALRGFERDLRMGLKRNAQLVVADEHDVVVAMPAPATPAPAMPAPAMPAPPMPMQQPVTPERPVIPVQQPVMPVQPEVPVQQPPAQWWS